MEIDWFASQHNAKLPVFYSRFWNEHCTGVAAFASYWGNNFGLFVPPVTLVSKVLRKMRYDRASGVLVVPLWMSSSFWPLLWRDNDFIENVLDWFDLPQDKDFYIPCKNGSGIFGNEDLKFRMLALKLKF